MKKTKLFLTKRSKVFQELLGRHSTAWRNVTINPKQKNARHINNTGIKDIKH